MLPRFSPVKLTLVFVCLIIRAESSPDKSIILDAADITTDYDIDSQSSVHLEAFKSSTNDAIIQSKDQALYGQLIWFSIGHPQIVPVLKNTTNNKQSEYFNFNTEGFYFHVELLNKDYRNALVEVIKEKYNVVVQPKQIVHFVPSNFNCALEFYSNEEKILINGKVNEFFKFPLRIDFKAPAQTKERNLLEKRIEKDGNKLDLNFKCQLNSQSKIIQKGAFKITLSQLTQYGLVEDIFGSSNIYTYITRDQLKRLSSQIYFLFDIMRDYQMSDTEFRESFLDDFLKQTSVNIDKYVDFDDTLLRSLSPYSAKKELTLGEFNIFTVKFNGTKKQQIFLTNDANNKYASVISSDAVNFVVQNNQRWSNVSLDEQLNELNNLEKSDIKWQIVAGVAIMPKSIRVTRLSRSLFARDLTFNKVKKDHTESLFKREFILETLSPKEQANIETGNQSKTSTTRPLIIASTSPGYSFYMEYRKEITKLKEELSNLAAKLDKAKESKVIAEPMNCSESINSLENKLNSTLLRFKVDYDFRLGRLFRQKRKGEKCYRHEECLDSLECQSNVCGCNYRYKFWDQNKQKCENTLTIIGHSSAIYALAIAPNGDIASGSSDNTIKIWNSTEGTLKRTLTGHTSWVRSIIILPNGDLASASWDNTVKIWNTNTGTEKRTLHGHTNGVNTLTLLPNGDLASGSLDQTIRIWNLADGTNRQTIFGHTYRIWSVKVLQNGDLVSASGDSTIKIWNLNNGTVKRTLIGHQSEVLALIVLPTGELVSGSKGEIKIWNTNDGTVKTTLVGHSDWIYALAILPNRDIVSGSSDSSIKIWNISDGSVKRSIPAHSSSVRALAVLFNGDLVSGSSDNLIKIHGLS